MLATYHPWSASLAQWCSALCSGRRAASHHHQMTPPPGWGQWPQKPPRWACRALGEHGRWFSCGALTQRKAEKQIPKVMFYLSPCWKQTGTERSSAGPRCEWCRRPSRRRDDGGLPSKSNPTRCPRGLRARCSQCQDLCRQSHMLLKKLQLVTDNIVTVEDWLTVVIVRIHVEVEHLPTPHSSV